MNKTIKKILSDSYLITEINGEWIFTNEKGEKITLSDDELISYKEYIIQNIESFGYTHDDLEEDGITSFGDEVTESPADLKSLKKQAKIKAKQLKKQEKIKVKQLKKQAKLEKLLEIDNFETNEESSYDEPIEEQYEEVGAEPTEEQYEEVVVEPTEEQYEEVVVAPETMEQVPVEQHYDANAYGQQNHQLNQHYVPTNQYPINNYYQNNDYVNNNEQMHTNTIPSSIQPKLQQMNLDQIGKENNDEVIKSIILNISATRTSVLHLRKLLEDVKEI